MAAVAPAAVVVAVAAARACERAGERGGGGLDLAVRSAVPSGLGGAGRGGARAWRGGARAAGAGLAVRGAGPERRGLRVCGPRVAAEAREGPGGSRQGFAGCAGHSSPHCRRPSPPRGWDTGVHTLGDFALAWCLAGSGKGWGWLGGAEAGEGLGSRLGLREQPGHCWGTTEPGW